MPRHDAATRETGSDEGRIRGLFVVPVGLVVVGALLALIGVALTGRGGPEAATSPKTMTAALGGWELSVPDENLEGVLPPALVTLKGPGWVVVYADGAGAPGQVLGHSELLGAGRHDNVSVDVGSSVPEVVWFALHREEGNESFDYPSGDPAVTEPTGALIFQVPSGGAS